MPSTLILGQPAGPDGAGGAFQNTVEADRAALWDSLGGVQGVLRGFGVTAVPGQMALEVEANSSALVAERAQDGTASLKRGYHVYTPGSTITLISFDPASASDRNDAVVAAFVDTEDGALGTGVSQVGPQVVVVTGVSGTTTPRTDAEINAWIGRGGWVRLFDVPIASTDTEINVANIVHNLSAQSPVNAGISLWHASTLGRVSGEDKDVLWSDVAEAKGGASLNGGQILLPPGLYEINAHAQGSGGNDGAGTYVRLQVRKNAAFANVATGTGLIYVLKHNGGGKFVSLGRGKRIRMAEGDWLRVFLGAGGSMTGTFTFRAGEDECYFTATRVGN